MGGEIDEPGTVGDKHCVRLLALISLMALASTAGATEARYGLVYSVPAECMPSDRFRASVAAKLGYDPFSVGQTVSFEVNAQTGPEGLWGRIRTLHASGEVSGERRFPGGSGTCSDLMAAMAVAVAVTIEPFAAPAFSKEPPASPREAPPPEPAPAGLKSNDENFGAVKKPVRPPAPHSAVPAKRRAAVSKEPRASQFQQTHSIGLAASGTYGSAYHFSPTVAATYWSAWGPWHIGAEARFDIPVPYARTGGDFEAHVVALQGIPCYAFRWVSTCLVVGAGALLSSFEGNQQSARAASFWLAVGYRQIVNFEVSETTSLRLHVDVAMLPIRPEFLLPSETLEGSIVSTALGFEVNFGPW